MLWSTLLNEIDDSLAPRESVMVLHIQGGFFLKKKASLAATKIQFAALACGIPKNFG